MANRRFPVRSRKRVMMWEGTQIDLSDLVVATPQGVAVITEATLENFPAPTLIRSRGQLGVTLDASSAANALSFVTMGIIVMTRAALAAAAFPLPSTDIGSDWLWWDVATLANDAAGNDQGAPGGGGVDRKIVDSKAMRKIGLNEAVVFIAELTACEGTTVANICGSIRFLLKAP